MKKHLDKIKQYYMAHKERSLILVSLLLTSLVFLWIFEKPQSSPPTSDEASEMGYSIPKGFLVVPLELSNGKILSHMISRVAVIDVFQGQSLVAQNLKVVKLTAPEDVISFGALVPDKKAEDLQRVFSAKNLRGALRSFTTEPTRFFAAQHRGQVDNYVIKE